MRGIVGVIIGFAGGFGVGGTVLHLVDKKRHVNRIDELEKELAMVHLQLHEFQEANGVFTADLDDIPEDIKKEWNIDDKPAVFVNPIDYNAISKKGEKKKERTYEHEPARILTDNNEINCLYDNGTKAITGTYYLGNDAYVQDLSAEAITKEAWETETPWMDIRDYLRKTKAGDVVFALTPHGELFEITVEDGVWIPDEEGDDLEPDDEEVDISDS